MRAPQFITLARIDEARFVNACRHGVVHLTWGRATVRLSRDQLRRLAALLTQSKDRAPLMSRSDGELRVTVQPDGQSEVLIGLQSASGAADPGGSVAFLFTDEERILLQQMLCEAVQRLDKVLASGIWAQDEADQSAPVDPLEQTGRFVFSRN